MKRILIVIVLLGVFGVGWWLLSPLWNNVVLDEEIPTTVVRDSFESMDTQTMMQFEGAVAEMQDKVMMMDDKMPMGPLVLASAPMVARAHSVEGTASIIEVDGVHYLRFENLKTTNGPDLRIYLSSDLGADDFVDLGSIRATEGNVNYEIPAGTDITTYKNVLIWCHPFSVLFSYAQL
ncbi:MAG: DM13 domain-containing protein [bacterium]|nr:DM13 domain-containing protein [bacterium]